MLVSLNRMQYKYNTHFKSHHCEFLRELKHLEPDEAKLFIRAKFLAQTAKGERLLAARIQHRAIKLGIAPIELERPLSPEEQRRLAVIKIKAKAAIAALQKPTTDSQT